MERLRDPDLWGSLAIILFTIFLSGLIIVDRSSFSFSAGPLPFTHWLALIGGFWIAVVTPIYVVLVHRRPKRFKAWVRIHLFGNLVAFMLISVHFTYWVISVSFIGTGMALFVAALTLVVTGLLQRFTILQRMGRYVRFIHIQHDNSILSHLGSSCFKPHGAPVR